MSRPIPHLPWTRNGGAPTDGALKRMGGIIVGEAGSQWELKEEERKAEIELMEKEIKKARECMRAVKKIAALKQKEWESAREYGKRAEKLQAKLLDASDESWLVECFISGIYGRSRRRRVRSQFQKTHENDLSLKITIDNLRHWRRLPREYADDSESETDADEMRTNNNECETDQTDYPYHPPMYVLVETISPEILRDARVFEEFLENNNLIPRYLPSGPYSFKSIEQLQISGQQPEPPVETEEIDRTEATEQVEVWTAAANTGKAETAQDSKIGEQDAAHNMLGINDTLPMRTIRQMVACTDQLVTDQIGRAHV